MNRSGRLAVAALVAVAVLARFGSVVDAAHNEPVRCEPERLALVEHAPASLGSRIGDRWLVQRRQGQQSSYVLLDPDDGSSTPLPLPASSQVVDTTADEGTLLYRVSNDYALFDLATEQSEALPELVTGDRTFLGMDDDGTRLVFSPRSFLDQQQGVLVFDIGTRTSVTYPVDRPITRYARLSQDGLVLYLPVITALQSGPFETTATVEGFTLDLGGPDAGTLDLLPIPSQSMIVYALGATLTAPLSAVQLSSDGSRLWFGWSGLQELDLGSGTATPVPDVPSDATTIDDGALFAYQTSQGLLVRAPGEPPEVVMGPEAGATMRAGALWDERWLQVGHSRLGQLQIDLETGERTTLTSSATASGALDGDGSLVAYTSPDDLDGSNPELTSELWLDDGSGPTAPIADGIPATTTEPSTSEDGRTVAFASTWRTSENADGNEEVFVLDVESGATEVLTETGIGGAWDPVLSADGDVVVFRSNVIDADGDVLGSEELFRLDRTDGTLEQLTPADDAPPPGIVPTNVSISADGAVVAWQAEGIWRWTEQAGVESLAVDGPNAGPAVLADGRTVLRAGNQGLVVAEDGTTTPTQGPLPDQLLAAQGGRYLLGSTGTFGIDATRFDLEHDWTTVEYEDRHVMTSASSATTAMIDVRSNELRLLRCQSFLDVALDHAFSDDVDAMAEAGVIGGYADQTFRPSATVTRQAMAAFLYRLARADQPAPTTAVFDDVSASHPFATEIAWAADEQITTGYQDGTFRPAAVVTRQAAVAFLHRLVDPSFAAPGAATFDDVSPGHPFFLEVEWAVVAAIAAGYDDGTFRPGAVVTRQAAAAFLHRSEPLL
jgi:hypothetical protein